MKNLQWGGCATKEGEDGSVKVCWGARALHTPSENGIKLLNDRMGWGPAGVVHELVGFLNRKALPEIRKWAKTVNGSGSNHFTVESDDGLFKAEATPNSSYGYIYIAAWLKPEHAATFKLPVWPSMERIEQAVTSDEYIGFCLACGAETDHVEPDARNYRCPSCGENKVFGAEQVALMRPNV